MSIVSDADVASAGRIAHNTGMKWRRRLRRAFWALLLLGAAGAGLTSYLTRPAALVAALRDAADAAGFDEVRVGDVLWTPWSGLQASEIVLVSGGVGDGEPLPRWRTEVRIPWLTVRLSWSALLTGSILPNQIRVREPQIVLDYAPGSAAAPADERRTGSAAWPRLAQLPELAADACSVSVRVHRSERPMMLRRWVADLRGGVETRDAAERYVLTLRQVAGARPDAAAGVDIRPLLAATLGPESLHVSSGWFDLETFQALLPDRWSAWAGDLGVRGAARVTTLRAGPAGIEQLSIGVAGAALSPPLEDYVGSPAPDERFLRVERASGELLLQRSGVGYSINGNVSATLNGSPLTAQFGNGELRGPALLGEPTQTLELVRGGAWSLAALDTEVSLKGFALPTPESNAAWLSSPQLPGALRAFFKDYVPRGRVDVRLTLQRSVGAQGATALTVAGALEPQGASCRYFNFPYDVTDVRGRVRFAPDGVFFEGLHGRHGGGRIRADGRLADTSQWTGFDLLIHAEGLALDGDLYEALPLRYQKLLDETRPIGVCDARARLQRGHGSREDGYRPLQVSVDGRLVSASLTLGEDLRLEQADGVLRVGDDGVELRDLHGYPQTGGALALGGQIFTGAGGGYEVGVLASGIRLQQLRVRPPEGEDDTHDLEFAGVGDLWGVARESAGSEQSSYSVRVTDGELQFGDSDDGWGQVRGWLTLSPTERRALEFSAKRPGAELHGAGNLPRDPGASTDLDLEAGLDAIEQLLGMLPPDRRGNLLKQLGLSGRGRVAIRTQTDPGSASAAAAESSDIELEAERMEPPALPLPFRDLKAELRTQGSDFALTDLRARHGAAGQISARGSGHGDEDGSSFGGSLWASGIVVDDAFVGALPATLRRLFQQLKLSGTAGLVLDHVRIERRDSTTAEFTGALTLSDARLDVGVPLTEAFGELAGGCTLDEGGATLSAELALERGVLDGRAIRDWRARLLLVPEERRVRIEDVRGRLCGGQITGSVLMDIDSGAYELTANLANVGLVELLQLEEAAAEKMHGGLIDGSLYLTSKGGRDAPREGGGELRIRAASLLGSRVTKSVLESVRERRPGATDAVDEALLRFVLEGSELRCDRLEIRTRDQRFLGAGTLDLRSRAVHATLVSVSPEDAPRLLHITDMLEWAGGELLQFEISGTLEQPRVRAIALHRLTEPLRKLLKRQ